ncbi:amino acid racemase [Caulobacter segnis]|uniref:aspartate/glutamate racemase family protein n=1 Tax=Caulobacter segnis TaxID=88688 RepID=UPI00240ECD1C|nr:amino acid racemase [Caulobacter segnis]MDG2522911.1 amino acid racemase [Caulobacter segnis]
MSRAALRVGVLGGMGPAATIDLMGAVLRLSKGAVEQDGLRLLVDSNPAVPDRNEALLRGGPSPGPTLAAMARGLETAGADFLVMSCNTAHAFQYDIERAVRIPFVSMIEEAVAAAAAAADPGAAVGLLAADGCLQADLYGPQLARRGLSCVTLEAPDQARFMQLVYAIKRGDLSLGVSDAMAALAERLRQCGAQVIIAACTEAPLVLHEGMTDAPLIDSTGALARAIVDYARHDRPLPPPFSETEVGRA